MVKKIVLFFVLFAFFVSFPVFADDGEWFLDKPIAEFKLDGFIHASKNDTNVLLRPFIGKPFTYELFEEMQGVLYATNQFAYLTADVDTNKDGNLIISFQFEEFPIVSKIEYNGIDHIRKQDYADVLGYKEGEFVSIAKIESSVPIIEAMMRSKGFNEGDVEVSYRLSEEKNVYIVTYDVVEGHIYKVASIVFTGNESFPESTLSKKLESKTTAFLRPGTYSDQNVQKDIMSLTEYYNANGFIDAIISTPVMEVVEDKGVDRSIILNYVIDEGQKWFFGGVSVSGNTVFSDEEIYNQFTLNGGDVLDLNSFRNSVNAIGDLYYNNGYIFNQVKMNEHRDDTDHTVFYALSIEEGKQAVIEDITISGLVNTKPYVVTREMTIKKGDLFSKEKLIKSTQNILNSGLFDTVNFDIQYGQSPDSVVVDFKVAEARVLELNFGATFGGNVGGFPISAFLSLRNKNVGGSGKDISVSTNLSTDAQSLTVSLGDSFVGDIRWSNKFSLSFERTVKKDVLQKGEEFSTGRNNAYPLGYTSYGQYKWYRDKGKTMEGVPFMQYDYYRIALGYDTGYTWIYDAGRMNLGGGVSIGINRAVYDDQYTPFEKLVYQYHQAWQFSNKLSVSLAWDGRDLIYNTTKGYMLSQSLTYAGGFLFGLSNYIKSVTSASGYLTLFTIDRGEDTAPFNGVANLQSKLSMMLPQYWNCSDDTSNPGWGWHDPKYGATRYEMLSIDGMITARGFDASYDYSFMWDNIFEFGVPIVANVINAEVFTSITGVIDSMDDLKGLNSLIWDGAIGLGVKLKISGFPLGLYLVKNYTIVGGEFSWLPGTIFKRDGDDASGLKLVLAISTSLN